MGFKLFYSILVGVGVFIFGTIILVAAGLSGEETAPLWETYIFLIVLWVAQMSMCFVWKPNSWIKGYGLSLKKWDFPIGIGVGAVSQLALLVLYLPFLPFFDLSDISKAAEDLVDRANGVGGKILFAIFTVLLAPIIEEIFFRGYLQNVFMTFMKNLAKAKHLVVFIVAAIFALAHLTSSDWLPLWGLFLFGVGLGYVAQITRRLGLVISIHIGFNLLAFILASF